MAATISLRPPRKRRAFKDFDFPALRFRVTRVHAEEFAGEKRGFVAARAGADFDDDALVVVRIFGEKQEFQFAFDAVATLDELSFLFLRHVPHIRIFGFDDHFVGAREVFFNLLVFAVLANDFLEFGVLLGELLQARGIVHDFGGGKLLGHFFVARVELIEFFG